MYSKNIQVDYSIEPYRSAIENLDGIIRAAAEADACEGTTKVLGALYVNLCEAYHLGQTIRGHPRQPAISSGGVLIAALMLRVELNDLLDFEGGYFSLVMALYTAELMKSQVVGHFDLAPSGKFGNTSNRIITVVSKN